VLTTTAGDRQISGFSKAKTRLDMEIDLLRKEEGAARPFPRMLPWVYHDLRRTMRTYLSGLAVQDIVRELVIAHRKPGLHKVYDQHAYRNEKRDALNQWVSKLQAIIGSASNEHLPADNAPVAAGLIGEFDSQGRN
jgi:hypothetical protein